MNDRERASDTNAKRTEVLDELLEIYREEETLPDFSKLEKPRASWRRRGLLAALSLFLIGGLVWVGLLVFDVFSWKTTSHHLDLTIEAQPMVGQTRSESHTVISGERTRVRIAYENVTQNPLAGLTLELHLPDTFVVERFVPEPTDPGRTWNLGQLSPHSDGVIEMFGSFLAPTSGNQTIQAIATYRPSNFNADFDSIFTQALRVEDSVFELTQTTPERAMPGEEVEIVFEVSNPSGSAVDDVLVVPRLPKAFVRSSSEPPVTESLEWLIPRFEPHTKTTLRLSGVWGADAKGLYEVGGQVFVVQNDTRQLQEETLTQVEVTGGTLQASVIVNGSSKDQTIPAGSILRISIPIENAAQATYTDLALHLLLEDPSSVDWEHDALELDQAVRTDSTLTWTREEIEAFATLAPEGETVVDVTLPIRATTDQDLLTLSASISGIPEGRTARQTLSTTPLSIQFASNTELLSFARFFDASGSPLGSGPFPPRVDETTRLAVDWHILNRLHPLASVLVEATLPPEVQFAGAETANQGAMRYDATRRTLAWSIDTLEANADGRFFVELTPSAGDVGRSMRILGETILTARDTETGTTIRVTAEEITTQLTEDPFVTENGIVNE